LLGLLLRGLLVLLRLRVVRVVGGRARGATGTPWTRLFGSRARYKMCRARPTLWRDDALRRIAAGCCIELRERC
jgi:hypothetical protein